MKKNRPQNDFIRTSDATHLQNHLHEHLNWFIQSRSSVIDFEPSYVFEMFQRLHQAALHMLPRGGQKRIVRLHKYRLPQDYTRSAIGNLQRLVIQRKKYFVDVVIHGSLASGEFVEQWSDVDVLAIIRNTTLSTGVLLRSLRTFFLQVREYMQRIDPFQHHGVDVMTESDMLYYPESWLPLVSLRQGASLIHKSSLSFLVRDSQKDVEERFRSIVTLMEESQKSGEMRHHGRNSTYLKDNYINSDNSFYQFKYFVSVVLLLPSLFLQMKGQPVYKRESFRVIRKYFTDKDLELVYACENVRKLAPKVLFCGNAIPNEMKRVLGLHYFERGMRLTKLMWDTYESM